MSAVFSPLCSVAILRSIASSRRPSVPQRRSEVYQRQPTVADKKISTILFRFNSNKHEANVGSKLQREPSLKLFGIGGSCRSHFLTFARGLSIACEFVKSHCEPRAQKNKMIPKPLRTLAAGTAMLFGGLAALNTISSIASGAIRYATELKLRKDAVSCGLCRGKGFYMCKLCKGNATIKWSPLYDPIAFNPVLCPTCDGNRVQRCLNCLGKGYSYGS